MPRQVSSSLRAALFTDLPDDEVLLCLLTIESDTTEKPIRIVNNTRDVVSRGDRFVAYPFQVNLPTDTDESAPRAQVVFDNVNPAELIPFVRGAVAKPDILLELVRAAAPDFVEVAFVRFTFDELTIDNVKITGELVVRDLSSEAYPADTYSPAICPGIGFAFQ